MDYDFLVNCFVNESFDEMIITENDKEYNIILLNNGTNRRSYRINTEIAREVLVCLGDQLLKSGDQRAMIVLHAAIDIIDG